MTPAEKDARLLMLNRVKDGFNATAASVNAASALLGPFSVEYRDLVLAFNKVVAALNTSGPQVSAAITQTLDALKEPDSPDGTIGQRAVVDGAAWTFE